MVGEVISLLLFTVQFVLLVGLYGAIIGVFWTPFLLFETIRDLFVALPLEDWRVSYLVWIPVPALVWSLVFAITLSISPELRQPSKASPLYVGGLDGIIMATVVSLLLWPAILLHGLPRLGVNWFPRNQSRKPQLLVVLGLTWYLVFLIGPAYGLSVFAGFGDAMSAG